MEEKCCTPNLDQNKDENKKADCKCGCRGHHKACAILLIVLICIAIALFVLKDLGIIGCNKLKFSDNKAWQAVFLNSKDPINNQVYFGRIAGETKNVLILKNIYYVQVVDLRANEKDQPNLQPQLIKFGNEAHGPADEIHFNKQNILYIEILKSDSQIVRAIEAVEKK